jgi:hypothetical protein
MPPEAGPDRLALFTEIPGWRWAAYADRETDLELLDGDALLHTDFNPLNTLLGPDRVWIIDWACPTRGAAFIGAACFLIRAMVAGLASARLYDEIARNDPQPFRQRLAAVALEWACHRLDASSAFHEATSATGSASR